MHLEERIRKLCAKVVAASDSEIQSAIAELKIALRDHKAVIKRPLEVPSQPKIPKS